MKLTKEEVEKLAHLARMKLTPEEVSKYSEQLTDILDYVQMLSELDTKGVPETSQVTGLSNVTREDEIKMDLCKPEELLKCSPLPVANRQIRVKRII
ncbi:Asp-tRNA(Asn)/Glu-tRNA(Gln) amidotransferase subunit GatC [Patescibacteria group bacterium]|nr:Asp-tRNA(Asn)/Glu-tRNA(Gln) amidotransferase subunit GatC [Patescibacteria group bacterium]